MREAFEVAAPLPVTAVVITKNEADRILRCLRSVNGLCEEVLVMDSGSSDDTVALAQSAGARVIKQRWLGFSAQKNAVIAQARNPWVLLLDADEWLGDGAALAVGRLFAAGGVEQADVWRLQRRTHYLGAILHFGGWGNEAVERLFRHGARYLPAQVHERLDLEGARIGTVRARIEHDTARSAEEYGRKLDGYAHLFAQQRFAQGKQASWLSAPVHAGFHLLKNLVLRGGFLDGPKAWGYHLAHAGYVWHKYALLAAFSRLRTAPVPG